MIRAAALGLALSAAACATVMPINRHLDPVCTSDPYVPRSVEVLPARELDAGPVVVDTGVRLPAPVDHDLLDGEAPAYVPAPSN